MRCGAGTASTIPATKCRKSTGRTDSPRNTGSSDLARTVKGQRSHGTAAPGSPSPAADSAGAAAAGDDSADASRGRSHQGRGPVVRRGAEACSADARRRSPHARRHGRRACGTAGEISRLRGRAAEQRTLPRYARRPPVRAPVSGSAVPRLQDDGIGPNLDTDWVLDVLHLTRDDRAYRMDLDGIRREVDEWFTPVGLDALLGSAPTETERIGRAWLTRAGKR